MGRPEGFLFGYPGLISLTVPYHDTNDFYFSGHVGTCTLIVLEYRASKWFKLSYITTFIMINQWIMMTLVRTHYIIDLVAGFLIANYVFILAEKASFLTDVKIMGISGKKRGRNFFKPCFSCGWSNKNIMDFTDKSEKMRIVKSQKKRSSLLGSP